MHEALLDLSFELTYSWLLQAIKKRNVAGMVEKIARKWTEKIVQKGIKKIKSKNATASWLSPLKKGGFCFDHMQGKRDTSWRDF